MKKEIKFLLSMVFDKDKSLLADPKPRRVYTFEEYGLTQINAENSNSSWRGLLSGNEAWIASAGQFVMLNHHDLVYIRLNEDGRQEYLDGPQPQDLFPEIRIIAIVNHLDRILWFAPQCKNWWQLFLFKWYVNKNFNSLDMSEFDREQMFSLAEFLYRKNY